MEQHLWNKLKKWLKLKNFNLELNPPPTQFTNGMGNLNYKIFLDHKAYVLRRPPLGPIPPGANDMKREHLVMSSLHKELPLVPNSILFSEDINIFGAPFHIMEYKEGFTINGDTFPSELHNAKDVKIISEMLISTLVKIHKIDPKNAGLENLGKPEGFLERQLEGWFKRGLIAHQNKNLHNITQLYETLKNRPRPEDYKPSILHNDFKLDNIILKKKNNNIFPSAIIDWDQATRGHPLYDLATLLSYWTVQSDSDDMRLIKQMPSEQDGFISRLEAIKQYKYLSGNSIDNFNWIYSLSLLKLGVVFQQLFAQYIRGTVKDKKYLVFEKVAEASYRRGLNIIMNDEII